MVAEHGGAGIGVVCARGEPDGRAHERLGRIRAHCVQRGAYVQSAIDQHAAGPSRFVA